MKAARKALARFASKVVPSAKAPAQTAAKERPSQLDSEQLREVVGGLPKGNW